MRSVMVRAMAVSAIAMAAAGAAQAQIACESLQGFRAPDVKITKAAPLVDAPVPVCKVDGVIGKEINFSVWLPEAWNGKFVMGGQGGFAGSGRQARRMTPAGAAEGLCDGWRPTRGTPRPRAASMGRGRQAITSASPTTHTLRSHRTSLRAAKALVNARYGRAERAFVFCRLFQWRAAGVADGAALSRRISMASSRARRRSTSRASRRRSPPSRQKMYPDPKRIETPVLDKPARDILAKAVMDKCDSPSTG